MPDSLFKGAVHTLNSQVESELSVQVERRRAERARAAQLNMLSPEERQLQLAKELKQAMDSAKQAKATGNKKQKQVAGEVIRHVKLEIASLGIKEADIHKLIAQHFPAPQPAAVAAAAESLAPDAGRDAWPALGEAAAAEEGVRRRITADDGFGCGSDYVLAEARQSMEQQVAVSARPSLEHRISDAWDHEYVLVDSDGSDRAVLAASLAGSALKGSQGAPAGSGAADVQGAVVMGALPDRGGASGAQLAGPDSGNAGGACGDSAAPARDAVGGRGVDDDDEFNANMLWCTFLSLLDLLCYARFIGQRMFICVFGFYSILQSCRSSELDGRNQVLMGSMFYELPSLHRSTVQHKVDDILPGFECKVCARKQAFKE